MAFFIGNLVGEAVIKRITIEDVKFICGSLSAALFQVRRQGGAGVPKFSFSAVKVPVSEKAYIFYNNRMLLHSITCLRTIYCYCLV